MLRDRVEPFLLVATHDGCITGHVAEHDRGQFAFRSRRLRLRWSDHYDNSSSDPRMNVAPDTIATTSIKARCQNNQFSYTWSLPRLTTSSSGRYDNANSATTALCQPLSFQYAIIQSWFLSPTPGHRPHLRPPMCADSRLIIRHARSLPRYGRTPDPLLSL
jgi:hypothetical protein